MTETNDGNIIRIMVVEDNVDYRSVIALAIDDAVDINHAFIAQFGRVFW